jgi:hypothetical protein
MKLKIEKRPPRSNKPSLWVIKELHTDGLDLNLNPSYDWKELKVFTRRRDAKAFVRSMGRLQDLH